jgi:uncharacterized protein YchJ
MKSMGTMKVLVCAAALGAAVFALAACGGGGKSDDAAVESQLNSELKAYLAADWQAAYQIASPRFRTTCSLDQFVKSVSGTDFSTLVLDQVKVRIEGDKAFVTDRQTLNGKDVSTATDSAPEVFVKVDGKWYDDSKGSSGCS